MLELMEDLRLEFVDGRRRRRDVDKMGNPEVATVSIEARCLLTSPISYS